MQNKIYPIIGLLLIAVLCVFCGDTQKSGYGITVTRLVGPAASWSVDPSLSQSPDGAVLLSWIEKDSSGHSRLMFSKWTNDGWSQAAMIAEGDDWFVNWADIPAVGSQSGGRMLGSWLAKSTASTYSYDVKMAWSDDGDTWSDTFSPHIDSTPTEHGFVSLEPLHDGGFGACWLDGRQTVEKSGAMTLRYATIGVDGELTEEALLDERVCDCCQTAMCIAGDGSILVAYRDRSDEELRDISVVRRPDGLWSDPIAVANDGWKIDGCPVNGPALTANESLVAVSWFTLGAHDSATVYCAFSHDNGQSFSAPIRIESEQPLGRVDIVFVNETTALVSWLEVVGDSARVAVCTVQPDGTVSPPVTASMSSASRSSGFARMMPYADGFLVAWTELTDPPTVRSAKIVVR